MHDFLNCCSSFFYCIIVFWYEFQSEEKCRALQERLELTEQKLAQFSRKAEAAAGEALAQVVQFNSFGSKYII